MDILGIGPLELIFILLIALIIFGPNDMVKAGRTAGKFLRSLLRSEGFQTMQKVTRDMRNLPNRLMREAELEEISQEINNIAPPRLLDPVKEVANDINAAFKNESQQIQQGLSSWTTPPSAGKTEADIPPANKENDAPGQQSEDQ